MSLMREAGRQSNFNKRHIRQGELAAGMMNAKSTEIFPQSTSIEPAKFTRQMNRMYIDLLRDLAESYAKSAREAFLWRA